MLNWFNSNKSEITALNERIEKLEREVEYHKRLAEHATKEVTELQQAINDNARAATPSLDFDKMDAFSIERMRKDGMPYTVIGYLKSLPEEPPDIGEWVLHCSDEHHERLVREFNQYKSARCLISNDEGQ